MVRKTKVYLMAVMMCLTVLLSGISVAASSLEDSFDIGTAASDFLGGGQVDSDDAAIGEWIAGQRGMTSENLQNASKTLSPLTNIAGNIVGGLVVLTFIGMFLITAVDLLYIAFPPIRNLLYKVDTGAGGVGAGMMGGGRFSRYGGGMAGGGMMNGQMADARQRTSIQWISDEAIQCVAQMKTGGAQDSGMNPMQAGAVAQQAPTAAVSMRSTIGTYFKKRIFFMILLAMCVIVLTSSALLGTGVNLALWFTKIINAVNANIPK